MAISKQLEGLYDAAPQHTRASKRKAQSARQVQLQQQVGQAPSGTPAAAASAAGAQDARAAGQIDVAAQQQIQQNQAQLAGQSIAAEKLASDERYGTRARSDEEKLSADENRRVLSP